MIWNKNPPWIDLYALISGQKYDAPYLTTEFINVVVNNMIYIAIKSGLKNPGNV